MAEALIFHFRQTDSFLSRLNPCTKLIALIAYTAVVSSSSPLPALLLATLPAAAAAAVHLPFRTYAKEGIFFIILAAAMGLSSFISEGNAMAASAKALSFMAMVLASMLLADSTMPDDLARSIGSALSHAVGKSAYAIASAIEITLSMIPLIIDSAAAAYEAMKARGASSSHPIRFLTQLSSLLMTRLLDDAEAYIDALYSRGYDAAARRSSAPYRNMDRIAIIMSIAAAAAHYFLKAIAN